MFRILFLFLLLPLKASDSFHGRLRFDHFLTPEEILDPYKGVALGSVRVPVTDQLAGSILGDFFSAVPDKFRVVPYFSTHVRFWFGIYTQFDSSQIVLHDRDDLDVIYGVLHFSPEKVGSLNRFAKAAIMQSMAQRKIEELRLELKQLGQGRSASELTLPILRVLQNSKTPPPPGTSDRKEYYRRRAESIRAQTGQRDLIGAGLERALPSFKFLENVFEEAELPKELIAIAFLESSFNNEAHSRVGALGVWQFMPLIASYFVPKRNAQLDYRQNVAISTIAAAHLLRDNFRILKRWDLAVTAYNSGTRHLVTARRALNLPAPSLEAIFRSYQNNHHGFASKNFYSEFIALVHVLAYRQLVFPAVNQTPASAKLRVALAVCAFRPADIQARHTGFSALNPHLYRQNSTYPRGTIVISDGVLPTSRFKEISLEAMLRHRPNVWSQKLLNQSCSTR